MSTTPNFFVYVQALGGKFLGPNAFNANGISIKLDYSGGLKQLDYHLTPTITDDGQILSNFTTGNINDPLALSSSFLPILTMPDNSTGNPAVHYLTPDGNTIVGTGSIEIPAQMEHANLIVQVPMPRGNDLVLHQPILLNPLQLQYRTVVIVPGLLVWPPPQVKSYQVSVKVTMMCGCKVSTVTGSYWTPSDFAVYANVKYLDTPVVRRFRLDFESGNTDSIFSGTVMDFGKIESILFTAQQLSTGNSGALLYTA